MFEHILLNCHGKIPLKLVHIKYLIFDGFYKCVTPGALNMNTTMWFIFAELTLKIWFIEIAIYCPQYKGSAFKSLYVKILPSYTCFFSEFSMVLSLNWLRAPNSTWSITLTSGFWIRTNGNPKLFKNIFHSLTVICYLLDKFDLAKVKAVYFVIVEIGFSIQRLFI